MTDVEGKAARDVHPYTSRLVRRSADLGTKTDAIDLAATLKIQLKETIQAYLPGYTANWKADHFWDSPVAKMRNGE